MKAVLVINKPENCEDCPLFRTSKDFNATIHYCMPYQDKELFVVNEKGVSKNCPLRPLPQKREPKEEWFNEYHRDEFADGWNAYFDEIEKESWGSYKIIDYENVNSI